MNKKICSPILLNIDIEELYHEVFGNEKQNVSKCKYSCKSNVSIGVSKSKSNVSICKSNVSTIHKCKYCNKEYIHRQSKYTHEKSCKDKPEYTPEQVNELKNLLVNKDEIISELKNQIEKLLTKVGNTTNNTTNNNTININIRAFGNENLDYIKGGFVKELINRGPYSAIPKLLKEIHFNPNHMENNNIKILNRKEKYAKRYNGEKWEFADKNLTLEDMTDKAFNILTDYGEGCKKFDKFYDDYDDRDTGLLKKMKSETEMMILNNQDNE